jgi:hypothetical protein
MPCRGDPKMAEEAKGKLIKAAVIPNQVRTAIFLSADPNSPRPP